jgi:hypothetical protein
MRRMRIALALLFVAGGATQGGSPPCGTAVTFGPSCPGTIGSFGGLPVAGNAGFAITLTGVTGTQPAALVLGLSNTTWTIPPFIPLPMPLASVGLNSGCSLLVSPDIILPKLLGGLIVYPVPIPPGTPSCATWYAQWIVLDWFVSPWQYVASNGLAVTTG